MSTVLTKLAPFEVTMGQSEVEEFSAALGFARCETEVPMVFPICLLTRPEIAAAIAVFVPKGAVLVHHGQSFTSHSTLHVNEAYRLVLAIDLVEEGRHPRLVISGRITGKDRRLLQEFTTTLVVLQQP
jgi:hypothetical protein